MKLTITLLPILALGIAAAPSAADPREVGATVDMPVDAPISARDEDNVLLKRAKKKCKIVGASTVNCRKGIGTPTAVKAKLKKGSTYTFGCYALGERVIIDGKSNASWQYIPSLNCYVNGHYTDSGCTSAALGRCIWD